ncbi:MAG: FRG domain-containing protein, partial [Candidatus Cloacimonetes bacterium]|nr:FRG domain-containing protein [Candidatus Cloacimonadota bacterium]
MINETRIKNWNELQEKLFEDSWNPDLSRFRSMYAFRGLSDANFKLKTTLIRLGGDFTELEHHLLRNFSKYAPR